MKVTTKLIIFLTLIHLSMGIFYYNPPDKEFIHDQQYCKIPGRDYRYRNFECRDITIKDSKFVKTTYEEFTKKYGVPFQFLRGKKREIIMEGLIWEQSGFHWTLKRGVGTVLVINDIQFHGLYSKNKFFDGKGVVGNYALCKYSNRVFECQLPWGEKKKFSRSKFLKFFVRKRIFRRYHKANVCKGDQLAVFWNRYGSKWRCWNYHFWRVKEKGEYTRVLNYYKFTRRYGDLTYIFDQQPHQDVNACDFHEEKSKSIETMVWKCDIFKVKNYDDDFYPDYLPEENKKVAFRYRGYDKHRRSMLKKIKTCDPRNGYCYKTHIFYAVLTNQDQTRFLSHNQFNKVFYEEDRENKDSRVPVYTMENDQVKPIRGALIMLSQSGLFIPGKEWPPGVIHISESKKSTQNLSMESSENQNIKQNNSQFDDPNEPTIQQKLKNRKRKKKGEEKKKSFDDPNDEEIKKRLERRRKKMKRKVMNGMPNPKKNLKHYRPFHPKRPPGIRRHPKRIKNNRRKPDAEVMKKYIDKDPDGFYFVFRGNKCGKKNGKIDVFELSEKATRSINRRKMGEFGLSPLEFLDKYGAIMIDEIDKEYGEFVPRIIYNL